MPRQVDVLTVNLASFAENDHAKRMQCTVSLQHCTHSAEQFFCQLFVISPSMLHVAIRLSIAPASLEAGEMFGLDRTQ